MISDIDSIKSIIAPDSEALNKNTGSISPASGLKSVTCVDSLALAVTGTLG
jgi:hypothetical protein